jgi:hypothetical protein
MAFAALASLNARPSGGDGGVFGILIVRISE